MITFFILVYLDGEQCPEPFTVTADSFANAVMKAEFAYLQTGRKVVRVEAFRKYGV